MLFIHSMYRGNGSSNVSLLSPENSLPNTIKLVFVASPVREKSKDCLARNQYNVSEWDDMFIHGLCISNLGRTVRL
jgi:hypothetical protein